MRVFSDRSTQTRLFLVFGLLSFVAAVIAVMGIVNAAGFQEQVNLLDTSAQALGRSGSAQANLAREQLAIKNAILSEDQNDWVRQFDFSSRFYEFLNSEYLNTTSDEQDQLLGEISTLRQQYDAEMDSIFSMLSGDQIDPQAALLTVKQNADPIAEQLDARLEALSLLHTEDIEFQTGTIAEAVESNANAGRWAILILAGLLILGVYVTNQVTQPLHSIASAIIAFQNNTYRTEMLEPTLQRKDELGELARAIDAMASAITESNRIKDRFLDSASRFIPQQYLEFLEKPAITEVKLGDNVSAEMAVMFSDIRGFTTASEKMTPQENFDFINEYLKLVSPVIQKHEGFIVKFLGDGMMAIFPYGVDDAVQAGIEKQELVKTFNAMLAARGYPPVSVGVGIHTGHMMVGMIGEERRIQGDAFSDNVNLTSRVEGLNKFYGTSMIISEDTLRGLTQPEAIRMRSLGRALVKGRQSPLALYEVYEGQPEEVIALRQASKTDFEHGISLYTQGKFAQAQEAFQSVLQTDPGDKTARYYLERCIEWADRPTPASWDGVIVMADK